MYCWGIDFCHFVHWADIMSLARLYALIGVVCIVLDAHRYDRDRELVLKSVSRRCSSRADVR